MERDNFVEQEFFNAIAKRPDLYTFITVKEIQNLLLGGSKTDKTDKRLQILKIYIPIIRRGNFNIFFDSTTSYDLIQTKPIDNDDDKNITVGTLIDSSRLDLEKLTEKTITEKLKEFDIIPCLFPYSTSNVYPMNSNKMLNNKGPILFITWELSKNYDIYKENIEEEKLEERVSYKKNIIVAHFIHGQYFLLIPNQSKYITNMNISVFDLEKESLVSLKTKIENSKQPISKFYSVLYEKAFPYLTHFD